MGSWNSLVELFEDSVRKYPDNPMIWEKHIGVYQKTTYKEACEIVRKTAAGLLAMGLNAGDRVVLLAEGRNDWVFSELAIFFCGALNVPLSVKLKEESELKFRFSHSEARFAIVSDGQLEKVLDIKNDLANLEKIIVLDDPSETDPDLITMNEVRRLGEKYLRENPDKLEAAKSNVTGDTPANICYTSGTTADPKGIVLTQRNYTANIEQGLALYDIPETFVTLLILPWDHSFAHTAGIYIMMANGASIASVEIGKTLIETTRNIGQNIKEIKPDFLLSVPALSDNFKKNILKGIKAKGPKIEKLFNLGMKTAYKYQGDGFRKGRFHGNGLLKPMYKVFDKIIFSKVREGFGGNLRYFVGGGALLDIDFQKFFAALGIPIYQGYGLTEAAPIICANNPKNQKMGSSGEIVPNLEVKICDDSGNELEQGKKGEIVVKGENVMKEYWKNPEATASTIKDGWLYTGDMGYIDDEGYLFVLGRYKSLLISDDGEKFSPEAIEESLVSHSPYISQVMLYNDQKSYTTALFVPEKTEILDYLKSRNLSRKDEAGQQAAIQLFIDVLNQYQQNPHLKNVFPAKWLPSTFALLGDGFSEENRFLNSTLKMVRWRITEHYKARIDYLYTPEGKNPINHQNMTIISRLGE
ncbi:AMP-binding protein [candidate division KSB1 bacterium]|nr:AMP-binding protein [candidate division KSB1 bacterium]